MSIIALSDIQGVQDLCRDLVDDLRQGCSFVWLLPFEALIEPLLGSVYSECDRWGITWQEADLAEQKGGGRSIAGELAAVLGLHPDDLNDRHAEWSPGALMEAPGCPDIIVLRNLARLSVQEQNRWCQFAVQWSRVSQAAVGAKVLLFPAAEALQGKVVRDVRFQVRRVWRYLSALEFRLLARGRAGESPADRLWNEQVYASVAAGDPFLLEWLQERPDLELADVIEHLGAYAQRQGWSRSALTAARGERLADLSYPAAMRSLTDVPSEYETLWHMGAVSATDEYGMELHAAAAVAIGRHDLVTHRVWRGQVQGLYPVLDGSRQTICHYLTRHYGPQWISLAPPQHPLEVHGTQERPLSEFTHLYSVLQSPLLRVRATLDLKEEVRFLRDWRNMLAHYSPVRRFDVDRLYAAVGRLEALR